MHLRSLTLKGFKSFPDRTRLEFGPGVSVVVGPNGSGKSNVTDAVLWAMGEQSPLTVRGQSMQDVIFGGGRGVAARSAAEVEIVLDNSDGTVELPFSEISIMRRLDRSGEGEYRLNGARCRLADVLEVLSDTGLGKESHSVVSQGRVEAIVMSKPRDRRLLIEEAAGLGKHRRRRRRAQLKLQHTEENLDRALDVEREARTRLRPLKRQAEAAELHERLERQTLEARLKLACEAARSAGVELGTAEERVKQARAEREQIEAQLSAVSQRRAEAERALADRAQRGDALSRGLYSAQSATERLRLRSDQVQALQETLSARVVSAQQEIEMLQEREAAEGEQEADGGRVQAIEQALAQLEQEREQALERELEELSEQRKQALAAVASAEAEVAAAKQARGEADERVQATRGELRSAEQAAGEARRRAAAVGAELAAANQFLRSHSRPLLGKGGSGESEAHALGELLRVRSGCELALAAALGNRLQAALAVDMDGAARLLDGAGPDGGSVLLAGAAADVSDADATAGSEAPSTAAETSADAETSATANAGSGAQVQVGAPGVGFGTPPVAGAEPLAALIGGPAPIVELARVLLQDAWLVQRLEDLPKDFAGVAVTRSGRAWFARRREVRQLASGGADRVLAKRNERDRLIGETERAVQAEQGAQGEVERISATLGEVEAAREAADQGMREAERALTERREQERRLGWVIEQRRRAPEEGPLAVRRAQLEGELAAERRQAERVAQERAIRARRLQQLRAQEACDRELIPLTVRCGEALQDVAGAVKERMAELQKLLAADRQAGERMAAELRACAGEEAGIQASLRAAGEAVTTVEVAAQRLRDQAAEASEELGEIAEKLQLEAPNPEQEPELPEEELEALRGRVERLQRRREQLGPVNPLAQEEYAEAVAHVEELEAHRTDLETALRELRTVIRDTDRQIKETFEQTFAAAARNFEELAGEVFPGGSGRLRLVAEEAQKRTLGGQPADGEAAAEAEAAREAAAQGSADAAGRGDGAAGDGVSAGDADGDLAGEDLDLEGVEIEITPAGKSTKRLSLLSGGEKSMTALAFLFAVFLARQCPFYILDEVEAALDDLNLSRFLTLVRRYADRAQFIVITHQRRTMDAADWLYGVSMGGNGVSKIVSRKLPPQASGELGTVEAAGAADRADVGGEDPPESEEPAPAPALEVA
ncbi:MAG TPA: AAA family ATPase [Solirubrobacteraceae bacterium]|jgi:chromosome segregation protein